MVTTTFGGASRCFAGGPNCVLAHACSADCFATHPVFTREEYVAAHGVRGERSPRTADSLLALHAAAGKVVRVRRGLHAAVPAGAAADTFHAGGIVRVTAFERTLVDVLDAPDLGGGWEEVWRSLEMVEVRPRRRRGLRAEAGAPR